LIDKQQSVSSQRLVEKVLSGHSSPTLPIWLMRQAGRYLPEYKAERKKAPSFLDFCYTPELAIEVTLQPIRRFGFDASIIFSDILTVPDALDRNVHFVEGEGPRMDPISDPAVISTLRAKFNAELLQPVYAAVRGTRAALPKETTLLGFCGAPWTVATYMIHGRGSKDQADTRLFAYRHPEAFQILLDLIVDISADHLVAQLDAGADAVQIFDSWAGVLPTLEFAKWTTAPIKALVAKVRAMRPNAKILGFPRGANTEEMIRFAAETGCDGLSLDTTADVKALCARSDLPVLQGNLDPLALIAGGQALDSAVKRILDAAQSKAFIFNLGHGILPETPIAHVEQMLRLVRA
jgi:uroporphyrinogen decarboxylase